MCSLSIDQGCTPSKSFISLVCDHFDMSKLTPNRFNFNYQSLIDNGLEYSVS